MNFFSLSLLSSLLLFGCARNSTLGMKGHDFSSKGKHIIWLQVAGLSEEHLPLLRFQFDEEKRRTAFEEAQCIGKIWSYNLYDIRPSAEEGFNSQIIGSKNVANQCKDFKSRPVWSYFKEVGYKTGIFEGLGTEDESLEKWSQCPGQKNYIEDVVLWKQGKSKVAEGQFHYQEKAGNEKPGVYLDKTCKNNICYSDYSTNIYTVWETFTKKNRRTLFIIRDFSYLKALKNKNILKAKEILNDIHTLYSKLMSSSIDSKLILLTSSEAKNFEFPSKGKNWAKYEKTGKLIEFKRSNLLSSAWAYGKGAENFCGFYSENEVLKRLLWVPESEFSTQKLFKKVFDSSEKNN
jgi:hypothetical protein